MLLLFAGLVLAEEPGPPPAEPPPTPTTEDPGTTPTGSATDSPATGTPPVNPPVVPATTPYAQDDDVDETVEVWGDSRVARARAELFQALRDEGYRKGKHRDGETLFLSESPWKPQVIVDDEGWVRLRRQPPRVHPPGQPFADSGTGAGYVWCVLMPTACISVGGWVVSPRKLGAAKGEVLDATHDEVVALNDAVARVYLERRVNTDIPADLEKIWSVEMPAEQRRALLFEYWDSRVDTPDGDAARKAVESFLRGVVMQSDTPYTSEEIAEMNARRTCLRPFVLVGPAPEPVDHPDGGAASE